MSTRRKFSFPLATLTRYADFLGKALIDPAYQAAMTVRLTAPFITEFPGRITALTGGATAQSSQTGDLSQLTAQQQKDFEQMERLTAGARRTARLAFPGQDTLLSSEFQVGEAGSKSFSATIARARLIHAAALKYASDLQAKGWICADTTALGAAIVALADVGNEQEQAADDRLGLTNEKIIAANALYTDCLTIQNAARLQYPASTDAVGNAKNITERARFLLEEFPPRDRSLPDGGTQGGALPATSSTLSI
jgi:hypothetical protein